MDAVHHMHLITSQLQWAFASKEAGLQEKTRVQGLLMHGQLRTAQVTSAFTSIDQSKWQAPPRFKGWKIELFNRRERQGDIAKGIDTGRGGKSE